MHLNSETQEQRVKDYYRLVDAADYAAMYALFSDDIIYQRCESVIQGMRAMRHFYEHERQISGAHTLNTLITQGNLTVACGIFIGSNRQGESIHLEFADFFTFAADGTITTRSTYLANGYALTT